jgi:hypothetical protein
MKAIDRHRQTWQGKSDEWLFERLENELKQKVEEIHRLLSENEALRKISLPIGDELQEFIDKSEARKTLQGTPCFAQERLAFDCAVRETIQRLKERGNEV